MTIQDIEFKSEIQQIKEDTQLDTSEGPDLTTIGANYGIDKQNPVTGIFSLGLEDKIFRATIREFALRPKLIRNVFETALNFAIGPQQSIPNVYVQSLLVGDRKVELWDTKQRIEVLRLKLTANTDPNDSDPNYSLINRRTLTVNDTNQLENGDFTLILNPGGSNEEEVYVTQINRDTKRITLKRHVRYFHALGEPVERRRVVFNDMPQVGTLILEPGTAAEESVPYKLNKLNEREVVFESALVQNHTLNLVQASHTLSLAVNNGDTILQFGGITTSFPISDFTVTLDDSFVNAETVTVGFNDTANQRFILKEPLIYGHAVGTTVVTPRTRIVNTLSRPATTFASILGTALTVSNAAQFPQVGFPYSLRIGEGTVNDEVVIANSVLGNVFTLAVAPVNAHNIGETIRTLPSQAVVIGGIGGSTFLPLNSTASYPVGTQFSLLLNRGHDNEEVLSVTTNSLANNTLSGIAQITLFNAYPKFNHYAGELVEFITAVVVGIKWTLDQASDDEVTIRVPKASFAPMRLKDASFIHPIYWFVSPRSTLQTATTGDGTEYLIKLEDGEKFKSNGLVLRNGRINIGPTTPETREFINNNYFETTTMRSIAGQTLLYVSSVDGFPDASSTQTFDIMIDRISAALTRTVTSIDRDNNTLTITVAIPAGTYNPGLKIELYPTILTLASTPSGLPVQGIHPTTDTVTLTQTLYGSGYPLEDGNNANNYLGHYIYDPAIDTISLNFSTLNTSIPGPTYLLNPVSGGDTKCIIESGAFLPAPPFNIRVGEGTGGEEIVTVTAKAATTSLTGAGLSIGAASIAVTDDTDFSSLTTPMYVRVGKSNNLGAVIVKTISVQDTQIGDTLIYVDTVTGLPTDRTFLIRISSFEFVEELAIVTSISGTTLYLDRPLRFIHRTLDDVTYIEPVDTEEILLVNTNTTPFTIDASTPVRFNHRSDEAVELLQDSSGTPVTGTQLTLDVTTPFVNAHDANELAEVLISQINVVSGVNFPADGGKVILGWGTRNQEIITYQTKSGNNLLFDTPQAFEKPHPKANPVSLGTTFVHLSSTATISRVSTPRINGADYALYLSPDPTVVLTYLFDLLRAAGVKVTIQPF